MKAMSCGVLLLSGPVVATPAFWRACSILMFVGGGGGGGSLCAFTCAAVVHCVLGRRNLFGGSQLLRWFMVLLVICGTVEDEW